jgi:hypothetical protein
VVGNVGNRDAAAAIGELVAGYLPVTLTISVVGDSRRVLDDDHVTDLAPIEERDGTVGAEIHAAMRDVLEALLSFGPWRCMNVEAVDGDRRVPEDVLVVAVG